MEKAKPEVVVRDEHEARCDKLGRLGLNEGERLQEEQIHEVREEADERREEGETLVGP